MLSKVRPVIKPATDAIARPFTIFHPNVISFIGIIPPVLFFVFVWQGWYWWAVVALLATGFDFIDGAVARMTGKESAFGGFLDSTLDRLADGLFITAFGFAELVRWEIVIPFLVASYLISYTRSRAELAAKGEFKLDIGLIERSERVIAIGIAIIIYALWDAEIGQFYNVIELVFVVLAMLSVVTVVQRVWGAYERLHND